MPPFLNKGRRENVVEATMSLWRLGWCDRVVVWSRCGSCDGGMEVVVALGVGFWVGMHVRMPFFSINRTGCSVMAIPSGGVMVARWEL